jgi:hypothetical protein
MSIPGQRLRIALDKLWPQQAVEMAATDVAVQLGSLGTLGRKQTRGVYDVVATVQAAMNLQIRGPVLKSQLALPKDRLKCGSCHAHHHLGNARGQLNRPVWLQAKLLTHLLQQRRYVLGVKGAATGKFNLLHKRVLQETER